MRRALLLVTLLAAPSLAAAQGIGEVTFANGRTFPMFVNASECGSNATVTARWAPNIFGSGGTIPANGTYIVYGSNQAPTSSVSGGAATLCRFQDDPNNNVKAGVVLDTTRASTTADINLTTLLTVSGKTCADNGAVIYVCVQGVVGGANNTATNFAIASASVTVDTTAPPPPVITDIKPGNRALNVSWDPGSAVGTATGDTLNIEVEAVPINSTQGVPVTSGRFSASPLRFEGLNNDVGYLVHARAFTKADNPSQFSPDVVGTPQFVNDFWDAYKAAGGRDAGGCSSGLAGPLGLGILIATLALVRRRT